MTTKPMTREELIAMGGIPGRLTVHFPPTLFGAFCSYLHAFTMRRHLYVEVSPMGADLPASVSYTTRYVVEPDADPAP